MKDAPPTHNREAFAKTHPHLEKFGAFLDELNKETERGTALTTAAMLDQILLEILSAFLAPTPATHKLLVGTGDGFGAPLGTLAARLAASAAMGLLSEAEYEEGKLIAKIRNEFAHGVHVSFKSEKVEKLCRKLTGSFYPHPTEKWDARSAFSSASVGLILKLTNRPAYAGRKRLNAENWPD